MAVRVRFAPSPTGYLHIGGARTALFNWLYARHHGGSFVLRIEDTDKERSTDEALQAILSGMRWLGLDWDEGPFFQSRRDDLYRQALADLMARGMVYRCYATAAQLEEMRELKMKGLSRTVYDRRWRDSGPDQWPADQPYTLRFKMPLTGETVVDDLIQGRTVFQNEEMEDFIVARSDGSPTYNFCVVVDDMDLAITHIIRGVDHLANTPLQINLYRAFGATPPAFAHVGLIHGPDGKKYSKRHGAVAVTAWRDLGFLPEATANYLVRLGWSHGDQEIFSREELVRHFDLDAVNPSASILNPEKLSWVNQQYLMTLPLERTAQALAEVLSARHGVETPVDERLLAMVEQLNTRSRTLLEMADGALFFFRKPAGYEEKAVKKHFKAPAKDMLASAREALAALPVFDRGTIGQAITTLCQERDLNLGKVAQPIRVAVSGTSVSPPIFETLEILGKEESLARMDAALAYIGQMPPEAGA